MSARPVIRVAVWMTALLALPASSPVFAAPSAVLFPKLVAEDFPERENTVRLVVDAATGGHLELRAFHGRPHQVGFPSVVVADAVRDPKSGLPGVAAVRFDDDCLTLAAAAKIAARDACVSVAVTEIVPGIARLVFRSRAFDYQLQFTLARDLRDRSLWSLVPSGRLGEPRVLTLRIDASAGGTGELAVTWHLASATGREAIDLPLSAVVPSGTAATQLPAIDLGALVGLDFFYDLADFYRPWVVYTQTELVDEGVASAADNDPSQCEAVTPVCGAEYATCVPTEGGWYGCNAPLRDPPGWGGGFGDGPGGGSGGGAPATPQLPNWQAGNGLTNPRAPQPLFHGLMPAADPADGNWISYSMTSVLQTASTVSKAPPPAGTSAYGDAGAHFLEVRLTLTNEIDVADDYRCGEGIWESLPAGIGLPVGDAYRFPSDFEGDRRQHCIDPPRTGVYVLRYRLDPASMWDEGVAGEADNWGTMRGFFYYYRQHF